MDALEEIRRAVEAVEAAGGQPGEIEVGEGARGALLDSLAFCGVGYEVPDRLFGWPVRMVAGEGIRVARSALPLRGEDHQADRIDTVGPIT